MIEKQIDRYIVDILQAKRIDFLHLSNATMGKSASYKTTAYSEPYSCRRYFPDFAIFHGGRVNLIENGIKNGNTLANKPRKEKQMERMRHMAIHGGCSVRVITSIEEATRYLKEVGIL